MRWGLKSKSGIHRLITALEERGFIRRLPHRARAIEVIKVPESMPRRRGFVPEVIEGSASRTATRKAPPAPNFAGAAVPLVGRIAAGVPIEAIESQNQTVAVPPDMLRGGEHFALEVRGDSMSERWDSRWRHGRDPAHGQCRQRGDRRRPGRGSRGEHSSACVAVAARSRWRRRTHSTRRASMDPTRFVSRVDWWGSCGATRAVPAKVR